MFPPPLSSPRLVARGELRRPIHDLLRVERQTVRRRVLVGCVRLRNDHHHDEVGEDGGAGGDERADDEQDPHQRDVHVEVRREARADSGEHRAFLDSVEALRRAGFRLRLVCRPAGSSRFRPDGSPLSTGPISAMIWSISDFRTTVLPGPRKRPHFSAMACSRSARISALSGLSLRAASARSRYERRSVLSVGVLRSSLVGSCRSGVGCSR